MKLVYAVLVLTALVYKEPRPNLHSSQRTIPALMYTVLVYMEWIHIHVWTVKLSHTALSINS